MNKKTLIGLAVLAVAGIGYYMWKKKNETTSGACGCSSADGEEVQSQFTWEDIKRWSKQAMKPHGLEGFNGDNGEEQSQFTWEDVKRWGRQAMKPHGLEG